MGNHTKKNKDKVRHPIEEIEDATKYGEFVSSYFAWLTLEKQKDNATKMQEMTKEKEP